MSIMNQERSCVAKGPACVTGSRRSMLHSSPMPTNSPMLPLATSTRSSMRSMSESLASGLVPKASSSKFASPSASISNTLSHEYRPLRARSSHSGIPPSPLKRDSRAASMAWSSNTQSQFPSSGLNMVTSPPGVRTCVV